MSREVLQIAAPQESLAITGQNPFLDPFSPPVGGRISEQGQPLNQLQIPAINTLVYKTAETTGNLLMIDISDTLQKAGVTPREPVLVSEEDIGIQLNINLFGAEGLQTTTQVNPAEIGGKMIGRHIPTNYREAYDSLHLIVAQRAGKQNAAFGINELKRIARNLDLASSGNKDVLANRIRTAVTEFFGIRE